MSNRFSDVRDAKEYLIDRVVDEAQLQGMPLSDLERKMLYFSETGWTLPDMEEVNAAFERTLTNSSTKARSLNLRVPRATVCGGKTN
jgi:hypothetical protein